MGNGKPVVWLKEGHVCGFTLPLPPNVEERWRAGRLIRVNEDGSTYQGPHYLLPDGTEAAADATGAAAAAVNGDGTEPQLLPDRPAKNASRMRWADYAVALEACTQEQADEMNRDELIKLVIPPEESGGGSE
jgi:hypothetical protein